MPDCISRRVVLGFTTLPIPCAMLLNVTASKAMPPASLANYTTRFSLREEDDQGKNDDLHKRADGIVRVLTTRSDSALNSAKPTDTTTIVMAISKM
ncbi:hypothetical protein [Achromobacter aegrifaciens]|uniref:hypothetical protein n=1 Tax=Achromobacter aegrifaciens TaxID=1287736 RepID=UPI0015840C5D|nr:hypothetical protein [Achromobacter aegrifaciens]